MWIVLEYRILLYSKLNYCRGQARRCGYNEKMLEVEGDGVSDVCLDQRTSRWSQGVSHYSILQKSRAGILSYDWPAVSLGFRNDDALFVIKEE